MLAIPVYSERAVAQRDNATEPHLQVAARLHDVLPVRVLRGPRRREARR
jgi:hypothetical protein